ncbi:MAG: M48 family metallopeptidase [Kiritimatiellae bacterium]|nr:M48 family metallopeptidase [Kiritimatiellia bacterium]MCO5068652.1 M48 family metallopeptidase [Kiritimatiellia bacterium]
MFSIIRSNQRKSAFLIAALGLLLGLVGYAIGFYIAPSAGIFGLAAALIVWLLLLLTSLAGGEAMLMAQAGAREITDKRDAPQLVNIVEEMQIASGLSQPPKIYIVDSTIPNAFAVGRNEKRAAVAVTTGLLARLNRDELQGVIAHEIAHIRHRDTLFMTIAGTTFGAIVLLADFFVRGLRFSAAGQRRSSNRNNNGGAILLILALLLAILAPLLAQLLYFACSRRREYLADASAVQFTRYPEGLASALEKIAGAQKPDAATSRVLAPMYIINPQAAMGRDSDWLSTHPSTKDRIRILRSIGSTASLQAYEAAYQNFHGGKHVLGDLTATDTAEPVRPPSPIALAAIALPPAWRTARGVLHEVDDARIVDCSCGLRIRIPPAWRGSEITCPRCGSIHKIESEADPTSSQRDA